VQPITFSGEAEVSRTSTFTSSIALAPFDATRTRKYQEAWAKRLSVPLETTNSIGMTFVLVPPGEFLMGSPDSDKSASGDEKPQHRVRITKSFCFGVCEVTQAQYQKVMNANPSRFKDSGPDAPVEGVLWRQASAFCERLSRRPGERNDDGVYRLPTEAEWKYAARAGTVTPWFFGNEGGSLTDYAWWSGNSARKTHEVRKRKQNAFGLYDVYGNVCEWCSDLYSRDFYRQLMELDPVGPDRGVAGVARGGSWINQNPAAFRSACRHILPDRSVVGFRVVRTIRQLDDKTPP